MKLQSSASNRFWFVFGIVLTSLDTFLKAASRYIWSIKMQRLEAELSIVGNSTWRLKTPPPTVLEFWLVSLQGSHEKVVEKMSLSFQKKLIKNFLEWPRCVTVTCQKKLFSLGSSWWHSRARPRCTADQCSGRYSKINEEIPTSQETSQTYMRSCANPNDLERLSR